MELIDRIKKDIDDRLEELRPQIEEIARLEAALAALDATGRADAATAERGRRARTQTGGARRRGPRLRARRGQRREELLQLIRGNPEITVAEAARQMGVSAPQASTLVRRLRQEGMLTRAGGRFVVSEPSTFSADNAPSDGAEGATARGDAPASGASDAEEASAPEPDPAEIEGPGVEGRRPAAAGDEVTDAPEAARDEAGRPQAT